ncbi:MAG: signal peptidase II, partial [Gammaproteobacteria bacterium]|nr:signal peptidase II [Gammaproteobacteria bacterium]
MFKWLWLSALVLVLDQVTKFLASDLLELHRPVMVVPWLHMTLMHNSGAAFSFLSNAGGWQRWFLVVLALGISGGIIYWLKTLPKDARWLPAALALVLGGALGNVWDRA